MKKFALLAVIAILPAIGTGPAHAMAAIQEPGAYAFYRPNANLGVGSGPRVASHKAFGAFALVPAATGHTRGHR